MVGHGVVGVVLGGRRRQHLFEGRDAVGEIGVRVQVAAHLFQRHDLWELAGEGGFDLATIFPQRRFDERQPESFVDVALGLRGDQLVGLHLEEPVLVQLETLTDGHLPDPHVVRLRPGEVDHRRTPGLVGDHP